MTLYDDMQRNSILNFTGLNLVNLMQQAADEQMRLLDSLATPSTLDFALKTAGAALPVNNIAAMVEAMPGDSFAAVGALPISTFATAADALQVNNIAAQMAALPFPSFEAVGAQNLDLMQAAAAAVEALPPNSFASVGALNLDLVRAAGERDWLGVSPEIAAVAARYAGQVAELGLPSTLSGVAEAIQRSLMPSPIPGLVTSDLTGVMAAVAQAAARPSYAEAAAAEPIDQAAVPSKAMSKRQAARSVSSRVHRTSQIAYEQRFRAGLAALCFIAALSVEYAVREQGMVAGYTMFWVSAAVIICYYASFLQKK